MRKTRAFKNQVKTLAHLISKNKRQKSKKHLNLMLFRCIIVMVQNL